MSVSVSENAARQDIDSPKPVVAQADPAAGSLRRLWPQIRWYRRAMFVAAALSALGMLCDILLPVLTGRIVDGPVTHREFGAIWYPLLMVAALAAVSTVTAWIRRWMVAHPASRLELDLQPRIQSPLAKEYDGQHGHEHDRGPDDDSPHQE